MLVRTLKKTLTPPMAVALLALFVALAGTGYAAGVLPRNSVGSAQLKTGAVKSGDLGAKAVTSAKIKNGSIAAEDLALAASGGQPTLRHGQSITAGWAIGAAQNTVGGQAITFPNRLPASFNTTHVDYRGEGEPATTHCPGPGKAAPGWACFYTSTASTVSLDSIRDFVGETDRIDRFGAIIFMGNTGGGYGYAHGSFTVTAP